MNRNSTVVWTGLNILKIYNLKDLGDHSMTTKSSAVQHDVRLHEGIIQRTRFHSDWLSASFPPKAFPAVRSRIHSCTPAVMACYGPLFHLSIIFHLLRMQVCAVNFQLPTVSRLENGVSSGLSTF